MGPEATPTMDARAMPGEASRLPSWRQLHPGDDPAVEAVQMAGWAASSPAENLARAGQLTLAMRQLIWLGLQQQYPQADEADLSRRLAERLLGPECANRLQSQTRR